MSLNVFNGHKKKVHHIFFSHDGKLLGSVSEKECRLWDVETGSCIASYPFEWASFYNGGNMLAGLQDNVIRILELKTDLPSCISWEQRQGK
ncbi:MAG: hypothetical protein D3908_16885 [Candidatus Electrothrix sp. AUS4]|nr:hypothetical protein [Candidatus Electrothrix sp. AUS4]